MSSQRRRRTPLSKTSKSTLRKRRVVKKRPSFQFSWRNGLIKTLIILILLFDIALIISAFCRSSEQIEPIETLIEKPAVSKILQMEVLNGCGVPKIASKFTDYLRESGIDVVKTDNYIEFGESKFNVIKTILIDRRGIIENAYKIADILKLDRSRVLQEVNEAYLVDATLILGSDFRSLKCWKIMEN